MKHTTFITILLTLLVAACSTLNIREIKSMKKTHFQNMELSPGQVHNKLRIDVIRQVTETYVDETTSICENVPYHPLGFDLGNGLFFDMNGNLSLRLDQLLDFDSNEPFEINQNVKPANDANISLYTYINGALAITRLPHRNSKVQYHMESYPDSAVYMRKDRFRYAIMKTDKSLTYAYRNNKPLKIIKINEDNYYTFRRKRLREFRNIDNTLVLGKTFTMRLSDEKNIITVNSPWRERNNKKPLMSIQKDENSIFIYSKNYKGIKIEFTENGLYVTGPGIKTILYKKIEGSGNFNAQSIIG